MKFTAKKQITVTEEVEVDGRIYQDESKAWKIANIILADCLRRFADDLYHDDIIAVSRAAERINNAFRLADKIMGIV